MVQHAHTLHFSKLYVVMFYVFLQQVQCVHNHVTISYLYLYVTFQIIKCDEILFKKLKLKYNWN